MKTDATNRMSPLDIGALLWPQLLMAGRLAIRPARVGMALALLLVLQLLWWLPELWFGKDPTPTYSVSGFTTEAFALMRQGFFTLDAASVVAGVRELFLDMPVYLVHHYPWTMALLAIPTLLAWTVLGGAITRSVAEEFSLRKRQSWTDSLAFSLSRVWSFFFSLVVPVLIAVGIAVGIMGLGYLLLRIPGVNIAGGVAFGLLLLGGFVLIIVVAAFAIGSGLLLPAVACEGVDAIDATQRTYAYALARPVRTILYLSILLVVGMILAAVLAFVVESVLHLTANLAGTWLPSEVRDTLYTAATTRGVNTTKGSPFGLAGTAHIVALWCAIPGLIAGAILLSYAFSGTTIMYLLLRRVCDGQDPADLWSPGMVAGTLSHEAAERKAAPAVGEDEDDERD